MHTDKPIAIILAVTIPIVTFFGAFALCLCLAGICGPTGFTILTLFWGAAPPLILSIGALFPWLNDVPSRWALSVAGLIPAILFFVLTLGNVAAAGHDTRVLLVLSPMIAAAILPSLPLYPCFRQQAIPTSKRVIGFCYSILLLIAVLWSAFFLWAITDRTLI